jgi:hypothetical protein
MTIGATAIEMPAQNAILLVDVMGNIPKLYELMRIFDQKPSDRLYRMVLHCNNISASKIVNELTEILPILGFPVSTGQNNVYLFISWPVAVDRGDNHNITLWSEKWFKRWTVHTAGTGKGIHHKIVNSKASNAGFSAIFRVKAPPWPRQQTANRRQRVPLRRKATLPISVFFFLVLILLI